MLESTHGERIFSFYSWSKETEAEEPLLVAIEPGNSRVLFAGIEPAMQAENHEKLQIQHIRHLKCFNSW